MSPSVTANLTISGTNQVSGTIVIGAVAVHNFSAGPTGRGEDGWTSATITLTPKIADSVVGNTYMIGSAGFPSYLLALDASDQFPSETGCRQQPVAESGRAVVGRPIADRHHQRRGQYRHDRHDVERDGTGWICNDVDGNVATGACPRASSFRGRGNFENVLLKITTDGAGNAIAVEGFLVQGGAGAAEPRHEPELGCLDVQRGGPGARRGLAARRRTRRARLAAPSPVRRPAGSSDMKKVIATAGAVGLAALAFQTADAAVMTGTVSKTANTCPTAIGCHQRRRLLLQRFIQPARPPIPGSARTGAAGFIARVLR